MRTKLACPALFVVAVSALGANGDRPRVFITESTAAQVTGEAATGDVKGSLAFTGGTSPQSVEVMKEFVRHCPSVTVTANRDKADYILRLDHEAINPMSPFVHGNKVALFDKDEDLVYSTATRTLGSAVRDACAAMNGKARK